MCCVLCAVLCSPNSHSSHASAGAVRVLLRMGANPNAGKLTGPVRDDV